MFESNKSLTGWIPQTKKYFLTQMFVYFVEYIFGQKNTVYFIFGWNLICS